MVGDSRCPNIIWPLLVGTQCDHARCNGHLTAVHLCDASRSNPSAVVLGTASAIALGHDYDHDHD